MRRKKSEKVRGMQYIKFWSVRTEKKWIENSKKPQSNKKGGRKTQTMEYEKVGAPTRPTSNI